MSKQDNGISANHYQLPVQAAELQDLISHRNMNAQDGESFRALYRKGVVGHSNVERDTCKILRYQLEELMRLQGTKPNKLGEYRTRLESLVRDITA